MDGRPVLPKNMLLDGSYRIERMIGSGGFGITYEAEDIHLGTKVAIKEYYPEEFGQRDASLRVRPTSEKQKVTFEWGRTSFLQEARTLARFRHPSVVQVTRVFEANSTAYMVMLFEKGQTFETWLRHLGRAPTQEELDRIAVPLLGALEIMHAENFLHRDIAPDNIIVRADGTPVLLDFGSARRAVAERTQALTGIVKAGYSPHEQYSTDSRLQGPWSDLYALGGTLYRAVSGQAPEEATLRVDQDRVQPASKVARGTYRPNFLAAIDACLKVRYAERPQSVAQLRPMLCAPTPTVGMTRKIAETKPARVLSVRRGLWAAVVGLTLAVGVYGGLTYTRRDAEERARVQDGRLQEEAQAEKKREEEVRLPDNAPSMNHRQRAHVPELGLSVRASSNRTWPVIIADIDKGSEADQWGIKINDVIMTIDGRAVNEPYDVVKAVNEATNLTKLERKSVLLLIKSGDQTRYFAVKLKMPEPPADPCGVGLPKGSPFHNFFCNPRVSELGLSIQSRPDHNGPVTITNVDKDSEADQWRIKVNDAIVAIAGRDVKDANDVMKAVAEATKLGRQSILLLIKSGDQTRFIAIKLKMPEEPSKPAPSQEKK